jgi:general secretion pathway protein G
MMMVVTLILIIASISTPIYMTAMVRAREAVLRDHLYTLRALIDRFTLDNGRAPLRLEELVEENGVRYPFQESSYGVVFRHGKSKAGRCRR